MDETGKPGGPCSCGGNMPGVPPMGSPCPSKSTLFTKEELEILAKLKALKEEARRVKARLEELREEEERGVLSSRLEEEKRVCQDRLSHLRVEWEEFRQKGDEAARQRMIHLGHLEE